eukprot:GHVL01010349.1.p1 GENE.GHVL01010349.1~~GHVL01010349.1.p1  ORF type:complete len:251 (+),score=36.09 GHVL01010349.1:55-807(+)
MSPKSKKIAPAPLSQGGSKSVIKDARFQAHKKNFRIGGDILPKDRDLTRFVRWPKYIVLQRQKAILKKRLKVPPALNQFTHTFDKNQTSQLLKLLSKYKPETRAEKHKRLLDQATAQAAGVVNPPTKKPVLLKYGLNHITTLVENKQAKLVVIAHDVDPIELVVWLPALCRKKEVPYVIVKGKSHLGKLVHKKTSCVVALTHVRKEDTKELDNMIDTAMTMFNKNIDLRRSWGGHIMSSKHNRKQQQRIS